MIIWKNSSIQDSRIKKKDQRDEIFYAGNMFMNLMEDGWSIKADGPDYFNYFTFIGLKKLTVEINYNKRCWRQTDMNAIWGI